MAATKRFDLNDIENRTTERLCKIDDVVEKDLNPILSNKSLSANKKIILLLSLITVDPFTEKEREERYKEYVKLHHDLVNKWKEVYCVREINGHQLIQLY